MRTLGVSRIAAVRSTGYLFLSRFFRYPEEEEEHPGEKVRLWVSENFPAWRMIALQLIKPDMEALRTEHRAVFFQRMHPQESAYFCQDSVSQVRLQKDIADYMESFQVPIREKDGPADSITSELAFMAFLTFKEGAAWGTHKRSEALDFREAQRKFLINHLGRWYAAFSVNLGNLTENPFLLSAGRLLESFVGWDMKEELHLNPEKGGTGDSR